MKFPKYEMVKMARKISDKTFLYYLISSLKNGSRADPLPTHASKNIGFLGWNICNDIKMKLPQVTLLKMTNLFILLFNNISIMQKQIFVCKTRWNFQNLRCWRWLGKSAIIPIQFIRWKGKVTPSHCFSIPIWVVSTKGLCKCNPCLESTPPEDPCLNMCTPWT